MTLMKCDYCGGEYHRIEDHCCSCEQLSDENAELRKDAERMDWAEQNSKDMGTHWEIRTGSQIGTLRDAIDAAMKGQAARNA